ncbi:MAG: GNAT family N-acetyltransferase [Pseudomonadota bacterium]
MADQGIVIRAATPADRDDIVALHRDLTAFEAPLTNDRDTSLEAAEVAFADLETTIARTNGALLVAVDGADTPIGYASLLFGEDDAYIRQDLRRYAVIEDIYIADRYRGSGVGRALIAELEERARARGVKRLAVSFVARNEVARSTYESFGFRPYVFQYVKDIS